MALLGGDPTRFANSSSGGTTPPAQNGQQSTSGTGGTIPPANPSATPVNMPGAYNQAAGAYNQYANSAQQALASPNTGSKTITGNLVPTIGSSGQANSAVTAPMTFTGQTTGVNGQVTGQPNTGGGGWTGQTNTATNSNTSTGTTPTPPQAPPGSNVVMASGGAYVNGTFVPGYGGSQAYDPNAPAGSATNQINAASITPAMQQFDQNYYNQMGAGTLNPGTQTPGIGQTATNGPGVIQEGWDPYLTAMAQAQNPGGNINNSTGVNGGQPGFNWNQPSLMNGVASQFNPFNSTATGASGTPGPTPSMANTSNPYYQGMMSSQPTFQNGQWTQPAAGGTGVQTPTAAQGDNSGSGQGGAGQVIPGVTNQQPYNPSLTPYGSTTPGTIGGYNQWGDAYEGNPYSYMTGQSNNGISQQLMPTSQTGFGNQGTYGGNTQQQAGLSQLFSSLLGGSNPVGATNSGNLSGLLQLFSAIGL